MGRPNYMRVPIFVNVFDSNWQNNAVIPLRHNDYIMRGFMRSIRAGDSVHPNWRRPVPLPLFPAGRIFQKMMNVGAVMTGYRPLTETQLTLWRPVLCDMPQQLALARSI
jgi:hypothetical protein